MLPTALRWMLPMACLAALAGETIPAALAEGGGVRPEDARPPGLILLEERPGLGGKQAFGVYGAVADRDTPGLWRIKFWDEQPNDVKVRSETIRCTPAAPMRVTSDGAYLYVRELNPGGAITPRLMGSTPAMVSAPTRAAMAASSCRRNFRAARMAS